MKAKFLGEKRNEYYDALMKLIISNSKDERTKEYLKDEIKKIDDMLESEGI